MRRFLLFIGIMGLAACSGPPSNDASRHAENLEEAIIETVYAAFAAGDMDTVTGAMAPDIVWMEAEGNPYADLNPYKGPDAVLTGLFARLGGEWDGFSVVPEEFVADGGRVIVFGRYHGVYKASGKTLDAPFVHSFTIMDGKIIAFQQYTDTAGLVAVMEAASTNSRSRMKPSDVEDFARRYADAWSSQSPESVATFFAETGSLTVNANPPAVGRKAIEEVARGFMAAFPDMRVTFDELSTDGKRTLFHWTLTGTNTGPDGSGNAVTISGQESWLIDSDGLVAESLGSFDADDYERQLGGQ